MCADGEAAGGGGAAPKGLFALPFMRRAKEQQAKAASAEASAMLRSIESEVRSHTYIKKFVTLRLTATFPCDSADILATQPWSLS